MPTGTNAALAVPAQRTPPAAVVNHVATATNLLDLGLSMLFDGIAGADAANTANPDARPIPEAELLDTLGGSDLTDGERLARILSVALAHLRRVR